MKKKMHKAIQPHRSQIYMYISIAILLPTFLLFSMLSDKDIVFKWSACVSAPPSTTAKYITSTKQKSVSETRQFMGYQLTKFCQKILKATRNIIYSHTQCVHKNGSNVHIKKCSYCIAFSFVVDKLDIV